MAKGRKLTTSRSERYLGSYSYGGGGVANGGDASELGEDDVWSTADEVADRTSDQVVVVNNNSRSDWSPLAGGESMSNGRSRRRAPRDGDSQVGGLSLAFDDSSRRASSRIVHQFRGNDDNNNMAAASPRGHPMATSAPVNVPDWSKIYRVYSVESMHDSDDGFDDRDSEMIPPHEYLAREAARSRTGSVFEGVGRTLKGRDLRRVRDAVWSQTGFDG
ncbi:hypothetical protein ACOSP7_012915 [Xanthoceras sorbifolium]|uniref:Senescence regulator n=1 Tax=Xanthoceras sorbifolium TaxID=99658 RepID=A0ABQ8HYP9_9ROSI|nr:hypothetical protein JRO89_XS06G0173400 [Xanthoceras sorbifolium]